MKLTWVLILIGNLLTAGSQAQPGHWRYSVDVGGAKSLNRSSISQPLPGGAAVAEGRTGIATSIAVERSLANQLSLRLGVGLMTSRLIRAIYVAEKNTDGQLVSFGSRTLEDKNARPVVGTAGLQWNSPLIGRFILTTGADAVLRVNTGSFDTAPGGSLSFGKIASLMYGRVTYPSLPVGDSPVGNPISLGAQIRVGTDFRLGAASFISLTSAYQTGFQPLRQRQDLIRYANESYSIRSTNTGNLLHFSLGLKHSFSSRQEHQAARYTAYNAPFYRERFNPAREQAFNRNQWVLGLRGGYWPGNLRTNSEFTSHVNARMGYAVLNRFLIGVSGELYWIRPQNLDHIRNQWLSGGPYVRYQSTNTWLSPFVEVAYQFGTKRLIADYVPLNRSFPFTAFSLTPGINLWVQKQLWLEVALSFRSAEERHLFTIPLAAPGSSPPAGGGPGSGTSIRPNRYQGPLPQLGLIYQFKGRSGRVSKPPVYQEQ